MNVGGLISGPARTLTMERMIAFESVIWDRGPTAHNDPATAAAGGMKRPFASGQNVLAFFHEMFEKTFGNGWVEGGSISVRWTRLVYAGDTITTFGKIESVEPHEGRRRAHLSIWAENQNGEQTAVGTAKAYLE
jgi:acyl dehydratase